MAKMKIVTFVLSILVISCLASCTTSSSNTTPPSQYVDGIVYTTFTSTFPNDSALYSDYCFSKLNCLAAGAIGVDSQSSPTPLIETTSSGGVFWNREIAPTKFGELSSLDCISTFCIMVGSTALTGTSNALIYYSLNSGNSFTSISVAGLSSNSTLSSVSCFMNKSSTVASPTCIAVGSTGPVTNTSPLVVSSANTLADWTVVNANESTPGYLNTVSCNNTGNCIASGDLTPTTSSSQPFSLISNSSGLTWNSTGAQNNQLSLDSITCLTSTSCIGVGSTASSTDQLGNVIGSPAVFRTSNIGTTWTSLNTVAGPVGALVSISCPIGIDFSCIAAGSNGVSGEERALIAVESGNTWKDALLSNPNTEVDSLSCPNNYSDWCLGVGFSGIHTKTPFVVAFF